MEKLIPTLHIASIYALLPEFSSAGRIASYYLTHLTKLMKKVFKGRYGWDKAVEIRETARVSIGLNMPAKSLELRHSPRLISELDSEILEIKSESKRIMDEINSPILTILGIGYRMGKPFSLSRLAIFAVLIHWIRFWHMLGCLHLPINPGSWNLIIPI